MGECPFCKSKIDKETETDLIFWDEASVKYMEDSYKCHDKIKELETEIKYLRERSAELTRLENAGVYNK